MMTQLSSKWKIFVILAVVILFIIIIVNQKNLLKTGLIGHYISDCNIYDSNGKLLKSFSSGVSCLYINDGSFIVHDENKLRRISNTGQILWEYLGEYHHQLKWLEQEKSFIALANDSQNFQDRKIRYTQIEIWNVNGERIASYSLKDHKNEFFKAIDTQLELTKPFDGPYQFEYEHINAVYEIPESSLKSQNPLFSSENLIVSVNEREVLAFIDKKTLIPKGYLKLPQEFINFHDAQIISNNRLILYLNQDLSENPRLIVEWVPKNNSWKTLVYHKQVLSDQPEIFGGLQEISPQQILFNVRSQKKWKLFLLNLKTQKLEEIKNSETDWAYSQQIKFQDVSLFLKNNQSL